MKFKDTDFAFLRKLVDPKSTGDLNVFLENLPKNSGQTVLIAAGIAWALAAALGLYTTIQTQRLTELRAELQDMSSLKPNVPTIRDVAVSASEVQTFATKLERSYPNLKIKASGSTLQITSDLTTNFTAFREAIGHVQNGGNGWRVGVDRMCVGRECDRQKLLVFLKINKVSVENPT